MEAGEEEFILSVDDSSSRAGSNVTASVTADASGDLAKVDGAIYGRSSSASEAIKRPGVTAKCLSMLCVEELLGETGVVCRSWRKATILAFAEVASSIDDQERADSRCLSRNDNLHVQVY